MSHEESYDPASMREANPGSRLRILNSYSRKKDLFVPNEAKTIKWYTCGPTVYDVAHLGHARCYITFDIIRRILTEYFGYNVFYVMNITDIDDKIIKKARSQYLCDKFIEKFITEQQADKREILLIEIKQAIEQFSKRRRCESEPAKRDMIKRIITNSDDSFTRLNKLIHDTKSSDKIDEQELRECLTNLRDVISDDQDVRFGHTVTEHHIFKNLTMKYEQEFFEDMSRLNVLPPDALTRVSEYIDEIGLYLKKIQSNGYAYDSNGSVYFDTHKFDSNPKHSYAKLVREAYGQSKSIDEAEGELSATDKDCKKSPNDFALWKKSKAGEPSWKTLDFEAGRPGWHIECSVMASHLLGENFDIHSGGWDLKFPHHDNEIAQAEAYYDTGKNWVNYFLHSGHLSISGCKMSKSLKNFITIRQALEDYTSRQLRFTFLVHSWADTLDYSPNAMNTALTYEKTFKEYFLNVIDSIRQRASISSSEVESNVKSNVYFKKWSKSDLELNSEFLIAVNKVDDALCDNFDTRSALNALTSLVKEFNKRSSTDIILSAKVARYILRTLNVFGVSFEEIGLEEFLATNVLPGSQATLVDAKEPSRENTKREILKYVDALAHFRADIRKLSKSGDPKESVNLMLHLCDTLRDKTLPSLGVRLEDRESDGAPYAVKLVDPEELAREQAIADRLEQEKRCLQEAAKLEKLKLQQMREEKMKIPPNEMFRGQTDKYSRFDDSGLPTHDASGKEVSKSALKKLQRLYADQESKYKKYLESQLKQ